MLILCKIFPVLAMLIFSVGITMPSAAAEVHGLEHSANQVAAGQHHHHAADGSIEFHQDAPDGEADKERDSKGVGHSHASGGAGEVIETAAAVAVTQPSREAPLADLGEHKLPALEPPPRERPPRAA